MAKEFFKDLPNTTTPLTATRLNGLLDGEEALGNLVVDSIKSKNLANPNSFISGAIAVNSTSEATDGNKNAVTTGWIPCEPNTTYIISGGHNRLRWQTKASNGTITFAQDGGTTLTTNATAHWLRCYCYYASSNIDPSSITDIQIEKGSTASTFSSYQNLDGYDNYSTGEIAIGTWINGKTLYRKVFTIPETSLSSSSAAVINILNTSSLTITQVTGMIGFQTSNVYYPIIGAPSGDTGYTVRDFLVNNVKTLQIIVRTTMAPEQKVTGGYLIVEYIKN